MSTPGCCWPLLLTPALETLHHHRSRRAPTVGLSSSRQHQRRRTTFGCNKPTANTMPLHHLLSCPNTKPPGDFLLRLSLGFVEVGSSWRGNYGHQVLVRLWDFVSGILFATCEVRAKCHGRVCRLLHRYKKVGEGETKKELKKMEVTKEMQEKIFNRFDANGDGKISLMELSDALRTMGSITDEEVKRTMDEIDINGDGDIDFNEFASFCRDNQNLMMNVVKAFKL
ncbi:hypothetical protein ZIOFF_035508 [Zingiber officinale]|uniref:EF-hand domain-containing protein n=1 Tax=Zingiber officinale TaxID=94328 RepID=A0A8J5GH26_ZINOF|nr:hypothetical protein ZIOFF_035508 [Zingiber officinale]